MIARRLTATMVVLAVTVAALTTAGAAAAGTKVRCDGWAGKTLLENRYERVFTYHGYDYGCARSRTSVTRLSFARDIQLAGRYVAYEAEPNGVTADLNLLDTATGRLVTVGDASRAGHEGVSAIGGYVVNARGIVVWLFDSTVCYPMTPCSVTGDVLEESSTGRRTLATNTTSGGAYPFTKLGLSADGTVAYWLRYGWHQAAPLS